MRFPRPGLRGKLAMSIAGVLLIALAVTYLAVYRGTGSELGNRTEADLEREMERISRQLQASDATTPEEFTARARSIASSETFGPNARVISISVDGGGIATNQPDLVRPSSSHESEDSHGSEDGEGHDDDSKEEESAKILESESGYSSVEIDDVGEVKLLTTTVGLPDGNQATVRVGQPLAPVDAALQGLSDTFLIVGLATLVLGTLAGWLLASSATRPMRRMASVAEGVDGGDLSARMPVEGTRDESRRLAESFNGMLERLEDAFDRQRRFVADASHDLRTPLTVVRGQIEVLARNPNPTPEEVRRVSALVSQATGRMEAMVEDLLLLARSESGEGLRLETVETGPLLAGEVEGMSFASDRDMRVGAVTETRVDMDRELISRALSNLISNAVAHTPDGGQIEVSAVEGRGVVTLAVDDDGPGIPPQDRERIFDRFARLDQARSSSAGGSGLGLAIVKAIAEAHGGSVRCTDSALGGARFEISIPVSGRDRH